jgi:hypothetical protein
VGGLLAAAVSGGTACRACECSRLVGDICCLRSHIVKFLINLSCRVPDTRPLVGVGAGRAGGEAPGPRRESPVQMPSPPPVDQPRGGTPPPEESPVRVAERAQVSEIHHCYLVLHVPVALYLEHAC